MTPQDQSRPNLVEQIIFDIIDVQTMQQVHATLVQVPRDRVRVVNDMNDQDLRKALQEFFNNDGIDSIVNRIRANDLSWITQITLRLDQWPDNVRTRWLNIHIKVAEPNEDDCEDITILEGKPAYPRESDEEFDEPANA